MDTTSLLVVVRGSIALHLQTYNHPHQTPFHPYPEIQAVPAQKFWPYPEIQAVPAQKFWPYPEIQAVPAQKFWPYPEIQAVPAQKFWPYPEIQAVPAQKFWPYPEIQAVPAQKFWPYPEIQAVPAQKFWPYPACTRSKILAVPGNSCRTRENFKPYPQGLGTPISVPRTSPMGTPLLHSGRDYGDLGGPSGAGTPCHGSGRLEKVVLSAFPKGTRSVACQDSNPGPLDSESRRLPAVAPHDPTD
ncbi:hypothetical protein Bbelb_129760 [Branchiostoma belcheri]|nr:hypothetical protein Bbelb_129760 [Branchiostoma belcheri]